MGRRAFLAWRKSRTSLLGTLLVIAIAAYGFELYGASRIGPKLRPNEGIVRIMGADAQSFAGASPQRRSRAILLEPKRRKQAATATWIFSEYATRALRMQHDSNTPDLVIDAMQRGSGEPAEVAIEGCLTTHVTARSQTPIIVPLRDCPIDRTLVYSISMRVRNASWLVRSVALRMPESAR